LSTSISNQNKPTGSLGLSQQAQLRPIGRATLIREPKGFSLTELIGVLAVLAIFAGVLLPGVIRRMDRAAWTKETYDMAAISNAITLQVLRDYSISNEAGWTLPVGRWTQHPLSQISTNNRKFARLFFYDQGGWLQGNLPYVQNASGTCPNTPVGARMLVVSTIAKALPFTNGPLSSANFNSVWNASQGTLPSFFSTWTGKPDDLVIQRITLDPLFHRLILVNRDKTSTTTAAFSINSTNPFSNVTLTNGGGGWSSYYLDGTTVCLWVGGTLTNRFVLTRDTSRTFEAGQWGGLPSGSGEDSSGTAQSFVNTAKAFISTAAIPGSHQGADTQGALSSFYTFMYAYTLWANGCPHFQYSGSGTIKEAGEWKILDFLGGNGATVGSINGTTGTGGGGLLH
jgi:prepilin-type N-terminal cleavage/methylation domain-containing protein